MAIEIKARFDGRVLYTSGSAQDVREALTAAVKSGAYLGGADQERLPQTQVGGKVKALLSGAPCILIRDIGGTPLPGPSSSP